MSKVIEPLKTYGYCLVDGEPLKGYVEQEAYNYPERNGAKYGLRNVIVIVNQKEHIHPLEAEDPADEHNTKAIASPNVTKRKTI